MNTSSRHALKLLLALFGCGPAQERPAPEAPPAEVAQGVSGPLVVRAEAMETTFELQIEGDVALAAPVAELALAEIARLERQLSEHSDESELERVNALASQRAVELSVDAYRVLEAGLDVSRRSGGAFDFSWAVLRDLYAFRAGERAGEALDAAEVKKRLALIDYRKIVLDAERRTIRLAKGMVLGTRSIQKGYALDRAAELFDRAGITNYMLTGGGQAHARGTRGDRPWRFGLAHPRESGAVFAYVEASDDAISSTGDYKRYFFDPSGRRIHPVIDTRTGEPTRAAIAVTLVTESGLYAEALSVAVFVLGPERGLALLDGLPFRAEAVIVSPDCRVHVSESLRPRVRFTPGFEPDEQGILPACQGRP